MGCTSPTSLMVISILALSVFLSEYKILGDLSWVSLLVVNIMVPSKIIFGKVSLCEYNIAFLIPGCSMAGFMSTLYWRSLQFGLETTSK